MSKKYALVTLTEHGGDETTYIVPLFVLEWINHPYNSVKVPIYNESIPRDVLDFFKRSSEDNVYVEPEDVPETVSVTTGSTQNDRALQMVVGDTLTFSTQSEAIVYAKNNDLEIVETFNGLCY